MRFIDFLRATVLICAGSATALAAVTVTFATSEAARPATLGLALAWWLLCVVLGAYLGRRAETTPPVARLLATARYSASLPEPQPGAILLNRLWPVLAGTLAAAALAFVGPQIPAIACGFTIIWALAWRRQDGAVGAIEERDAVRFYIEQTSPVRPMKLIRTPGFGGDFISRQGTRDAARSPSG